MSGRRYKAFISYSHADERPAAWLHGALERYRVPRQLAAKHELQSRRLAPIFRDREELSASTSLSESIESALADSDNLIVICSPAAAASRWVNLEIERFIALGRAARVFCLIVDGEDEQAFPPALRGALPLAADIRPSGDSRHDAKLKLIAGILGFGFDELKQREQHYRYQRLGLLAGLSATIALTMAVLLAVALAARDDADRRRAQAEDLISFMIVDLRNQLEPLGRLDILDAVGDEAVAFYGKLEPDDLSDDVLATRARALRQVGEVRAAQGRMDAAQTSFSQSLTLAQALSKRDPENDALLFEEGQAHFWLGFVELRRSLIDSALRSFQEYARISDALLERQPSNFDYRLEASYAQSNLGTMALAQGTLAEAGAYFERAVTLNEQLLREQPDNMALHHDLAEGFSWLGAVANRSGNPQRAISWYERELAKREQVAGAETDMAYRYSLEGTRSLLAQELFMVDARARARGLAAASLDGMRRLVSHDPSNLEWHRMRNSARLMLAWMWLGDNNTKAAAHITDAVVATAELLQSDPSNQTWLSDYARSELLLARLQLLERQPEAARQAALRGLKAASSGATGNTLIAISAVKGQLELALGDAQSHLGNGEQALSAWARALETATVSLEDGFRPAQVATRIMALWRMGHADESLTELARFEERGYRFVRSLAWNGMANQPLPQEVP